MNTTNTRLGQIWAFRPQLKTSQLVTLTKLWILVKPFVIGTLAGLLILLSILGIFGIMQSIRLRITSSGLQWQVSTNNNILTPNNQLVNTLQDNYNKLTQDKAAIDLALQSETEKLKTTITSLETKNQENIKLSEEIAKTKADLEIKAKDLDQKNKDLVSKAQEVSGLNSAKTNLQNQKTNLESQKALLEKQKKDLEKTIASGNFNQAKIPSKPAQTGPTIKSFTPPAPNNSTKIVSVIYFWFRTNGDYGSLCSGELDRSGTRITTVTHCQAGAPKDADRVIMRNIPIDSPDIFAVYVEDIKVRFGDNNYKIVTVDKGVVNSSYNPLVNSHCYQGSNICNEILLKTSSLLGNGNSGSAVYDPSGRFAGVLSGGYEEARCPVINVGILPTQGGDRSCSTSIIIALDASYLSFMRS